MPTLRFGLHIASVTPLADPSENLFPNIVEAALAAESSGFDAVFLPDHVHQNAIGGGPTAPMLEAYTALGAIAAATARIQLGALVSPVMFRSPSLLAKTVTTLDVVSNGRAILGIGAGWDAREAEAYGMPFPSLGERMSALQDAVRICHAMFRSDSATYDGQRFSVSEAFNRPRPLRGSIPILVGGGGEKVTLRLVAEAGDICNLFARGPDLEDIRHKLAVLALHCDAIGRDISELTRTCCVVPREPTLDLSLIEGLFDAGMDGVIVFASDPQPDLIAEWGQSLNGRFGLRAACESKHP